MTRIMGDSVDIRKVPKNVDLVATYADGHLGIVIEELLEELFPSENYGHILIDVNGSRPDVEVRDWENGDKGGDLRKWVVDHNKMQGKKDAVIYCNSSTIAEVRRLTGDQVLGKDYWLWVATLDGSIFRGPGVIACQNRGARQNGANFDTSEVFDDFVWPSANNPLPPSDPPTPTHPDCSPLQRALRVAVDNLWGSNTDKAGDALIKSWNEEFPYGVEFAQKVVGTYVDGAWGANSGRARFLTTKNAQQALINMCVLAPGQADGVWGPVTEIAYNKAKKACHI